MDLLHTLPNSNRADCMLFLSAPTTLMAVLNTARAVLTDDATRHQVHIIQEHLGGLARDFERSRQRMDNLGRHVRQASNDVDAVHISTNKITDRFENIERVEPEDESREPLPALEATRTAAESRA